MARKPNASDRFISMRWREEVGGAWMPLRVDFSNIAKTRAADLMDFACVGRERLVTVVTLALECPRADEFRARTLVWPVPASTAKRHLRLLRAAFPRTSE